MLPYVYIYGDLTGNSQSAIINIMQHSNELFERMTACRVNPALKYHHQIKIFSDNCKNIWRELDSESVNCRRLGKVTHKYLEIETKLAAAVVVLEQHYLFATLMS